MNQPREDAIIRMAKVDGLESLDLKPEEAFVLTRVNGQSTLKEIAQVVGYPVEKVWGLLSRCVETGVLVVESARPAATSGRAPIKPSGPVSILDQLDAEDRDETLSQIPRAKRSEILLRFQAMEKQNHYEVLGLDPSAKIEKVRESYFQLAKALHPDRFFSKNLGHYRSKLEELFDRVTQAFEELSDPVKKKVYDHGLQKTKSDAGKPPAKEEKREKRLTGKTLIERIAMGKKYFDMGRAEEASGNDVNAANFYQMATQFEPDCLAYQKALDRLAPFVLRKRAEELYKKAQEKIEYSEWAEATELMEEALMAHPKKRECLKELPLLYLRRKRKLERAREVAMLAVSYLKTDPDTHATLARVYAELEQTELARKEFKAALDLDRHHEAARDGLEKLKGKS